MFHSFKENFSLNISGLRKGPLANHMVPRLASQENKLRLRLLSVQVRGNEIIEFQPTVVLDDVHGNEEDQSGHACPLHGELSVHVASLHEVLQDEVKLRTLALPKHRCLVALIHLEKENEVASHPFEAVACVVQSVRVPVHDEPRLRQSLLGVNELKERASKGWGLVHGLNHKLLLSSTFLVQQNRRSGTHDIEAL